MHSLLFKRCSPADAGEYKVVAKSALGEATTFGTLVVNCELSYTYQTSYILLQTIMKTKMDPEIMKSSLSGFIFITRHWKIDLANIK